MASEAVYQEIAAQRRAWLERIAAALPGSWCVIRQNGGNERLPRCWFELVNDDELGLSFAWVAGTPKNRVRVAASGWPKDRRGRYVLPRDVPSITIADGRAPLQAARDIERRLLDDARQAHQEARDTLAAQAAHWEKTHATYEALLAVGAKPYGYHNSPENTDEPALSANRCGIVLRVSGESVYVRRMTLTRETAVELLKILPRDDA